MSIVNQEILNEANIYIEELAKSRNISRDKYIDIYARHQLSKIDHSLTRLIPFMRLSLIIGLILSLILVILIIRNYKYQDYRNYYCLDVLFSLLLIALLTFTILNMTKTNMEYTRDRYINNPEYEVLKNISNEIELYNYFK